MRIAVLKKESIVHTIQIGSSCDLIVEPYHYIREKDATRQQASDEQTKIRQALYLVSINIALCYCSQLSGIETTNTISVFKVELDKRTLSLSVSLLLPSLINK